MIPLFPLVADGGGSRGGRGRNVAGLPNPVEWLFCTTPKLVRECSTLFRPPSFGWSFRVLLGSFRFLADKGGTIAA